MTTETSEPPRPRPQPSAPVRGPLGLHPAGVFFALAAVFAAALPWLWLLPLDDPRGAHLRLGIFGFGGAAVAGYLLTAQRAWTGRDAPLPAPVLGVLALAARVAGLVAPDAALAVLLPQAAVALSVLAPVVAARRWTRLPLACAPLALALAEPAAIAGRIPAEALPLCMAMLVLVVGGRAVPAFLAAGRGGRGRAARVAGGPLWPGIVLGAAAPLLSGVAQGAVLVAAALWALGRLRGARGAGAANALLCLAYGALAPALLALAAAGAGLFPPVAARHLLTMMVMGPMILAFAARPAMRRPPLGPLVPLAAHRAGFAALLAAAALRAGAELVPDRGAALLLWSGLLWSGGWLAFLGAHAAALTRPAPFPLLSAARGGQADS